MPNRTTLSDWAKEVLSEFKELRKSDRDQDIRLTKIETTLKVLYATLGFLITISAVLIAYLTFIKK